MNRLLFAALAGLTLAIGLTVASLAWRVISFDPPISTLEAADPAIGYAFYDGIDAVLAGKPPDALKQVVSHGFVDHGQEGAEQSTDQLVGQLTAFRQSFPGTRLEVNGIEAAAGSLVVSIAPIEPAGATVAGLPLTLEPIAGGYEVLRVRNGRVTERWSAGLPDIELHSFDDATVTLGATFGSSVRLERIEMPESGVVAIPSQGPSIVMVESGNLRIQRRWITNPSYVQSDELRLHAGQAIGITTGTWVQLESDGEEALRMLRFSMQRVVPGDAPTPVFAGGATDTLLWTSNQPALTGGRWSVSAGSMRAPSGFAGTLTLDGAQLLSVCDGGSLQIVNWGGAISALDEDYWPTALQSDSIDEGSAASIEDATSAELRSEADSVVWLIALSLEDSPATPTVAGTPTET